MELSFRELNVWKGSQNLTSLNLIKLYMYTTQGTQTKFHSDSKPLLILLRRFLFHLEFIVMVSREQWKIYFAVFSLFLKFYGVLLRGSYLREAFKKCDICHTFVGLPPWV